jgi:hypothetical protein
VNLNFTPTVGGSRTTWVNYLSAISVYPEKMTMFSQLGMHIVREATMTKTWTLPEVVK